MAKSDSLIINQVNPMKIGKVHILFVCDEFIAVTQVEMDVLSLK